MTSADFAAVRVTPATDWRRRRLAPRAPALVVLQLCLAVMNLRLFANLGQMPKLVENHPFLKGTRLTLSFNNLFDTRQRVTDATGATPVSYQGAYLDPEGRTVHLDFRKLFF